MKIPVQPVAITVAFFFAYVVPTVALFTLGGIGVAESESGTYSTTWLSVLLISSYVICPVAGGYWAARLSTEKPYVHASVVSAIAGVSIGLMHDPFSMQATLMWILIFGAGGIVGAWLHQYLSAGKRTNAS